MNIKNTTNYKMFSILPMNREIRSEHVEKLVKSIRTMGIIRPVIICKTDVIEGEMKNYIVDGQHLATADFIITNSKAAQMCKEFSEIFLMINNVSRSVKFSFLNAFMQSYGKINQKTVVNNLRKYLKQIKLISDNTEASNYIKAKVFNLKK